MRPWIRSLSNILPKRPLRDDFLAKIWLSSKIKSFLVLKNSKCRASPVGIGSDTPSFWNLQSNLKKHELLLKTEHMHAALDSHLVFDDFFNKQIAFLKNVLATFCRSDKFKSFYTFVLAFELIRSTKGSQSLFQKRDLLHI